MLDTSLRIPSDRRRPGLILLRPQTTGAMPKAAAPARFLLLEAPSRTHSRMPLPGQRRQDPSRRRHTLEVPRIAGRNGLVDPNGANVVPRHLDAIARVGPFREPLDRIWRTLLWYFLDAVTSVAVRFRDCVTLIPAAPTDDASRVAGTPKARPPFDRFLAAWQCFGCSCMPDISCSRGTARTFRAWFPASLRIPGTP